MSKSIADGSGMTPLDSFIQHRTRQGLEVLEGELVDALYQQRLWEDNIMLFSPQSLAPTHVIQSFNKSKLLVQDIERRIRMIRYSF